jgi:hypothetical protein
VVNKISLYYKLRMVSEPVVSMVIFSFVGGRITYNVVWCPYVAVLLLLLSAEHIGPKRTEDKCRKVRSSSSMTLNDRLDKNLFVIIQIPYSN